MGKNFLPPQRVETGIAVPDRQILSEEGRRRDAQESSALQFFCLSQIDVFWMRRSPKWKILSGPMREASIPFALSNAPGLEILGKQRDASYQHSDTGLLVDDQGPLFLIGREVGQHFHDEP